ncbi:M23 family metallopeptidase [Chroococcus sp. FPU101]|uniref:LysM peptidoglycan-binding domain-containing M23 family metallopeptidase n=1 Tax=Chroococcus sp. FPU101 TaxID=1974212 RepID=UPI001A9095C8|nr:M23 family metallopeptidase [Chroococcus sp. FPU101]GFE68983.1 Peptidase M23 [Chroococcus sp. FPU101]
MFSWLVILYPVNKVISIPVLQADTRIIAQLNRNTQDIEKIYCPSPVLSRLQRHQVISGETVVSIAQRYNLIPETLISLNPNLQKGIVAAGQEILIPPFNGIRLEVSRGTTWKDLEAAYSIRADVLFEINGCQKHPKVVFIPGIKWSSLRNSQGDVYRQLMSYPLPSVTKIELDYGWQINPADGQRFFHSGIDLLTPIATSVLAVESGVVVYAGLDKNYGNLVIINHESKRQTRYAQLSEIQVEIGQLVKTGDVLGTTGMTGNPDVKFPHLHFEVRYELSVGWVAQDPTIHLSSTVINRIKKKH